jgi:hypothetical protein
MSSPLRPNATRIVVAFAIVVTSLAGMSACAGSADPAEGEPSDGALFIYDGTDSPVAPGAALAWNADAFGNPKATGDYVEVPCPETSTGGFSFLAERGMERSPRDWKMSGQLGFMPGTQSIIAPVLTPDWLINGDFAAVKAAGGDYSLGFACVENNGLTVSRVFYRHITVTAGSGEWVAQADPGKN